MSRAVYQSANLNAIVGFAPTDFTGISMFVYNDYSGQRYLTVMYNWLALSTKQNLDSAVTKTSDMTMRLTYTIREAT
jgi:hypothetical protein